jgi:hypothetical protein
MKRLYLLAVWISLCAPAAAQTIDDGIMMTARSLQAGGIYTRDSWEDYWEGGLKRVNGNVGTVTTQSATWAATYGLTDRITVVGSLPFVWTNPSQGVLEGQEGFQDLTIGGKYAFLERGSAKRGMLRAIAALSGSLPLSDYNPDFAPLSIGTQSRRLTGRLTLNYQMMRGWYVNGSTSYTRRSDVTLDRPYYYTDGHLFLTNEVEMPKVADFEISFGYLKHDLNTNFTFAQQSTRGGGDIRRQDMPFLSNRVNVSRVGGMAMYPVPKLRTVAFYLSGGYNVTGRNVGQSSAFAAGLLYSRTSHGRLIR